MRGVRSFNKDLPGQPETGCLYLYQIHTGSCLIQMDLHAGRNQVSTEHHPGPVCRLYELWLCSRCLWCLNDNGLAEVVDLCLTDGGIFQTGSQSF